MATEVLFPYQAEGVDWLASRRAALLAFRPGLGKSATTIRAADKIGAKRILVIGPAIARVNWLREFKKFAKTPRDFTVHFTADQPIPDTHSVITSFDLARRVDIRRFGDFDVVVVDEVHMCKSHSAQRTRAIFGKEGIIHGQKRETRIWVLSGTPAPNHAGELWPLLYTFGVTDLKYDDFVQRYCNAVKPVFRGSYRSRTQITGTKKSAIPELRRLLAKIMLRKTEDEVATELPPISFSTLAVEPGQFDWSEDAGFALYTSTPDEIAKLEARLKAEAHDVERAINNGNIELLKGLAKSVSSLRRYIGAQKIERVADLVRQELNAGLYKKVVIFAIHKIAIEGLRAKLDDFHPLTLYGGSKFLRSHQAIDKFNNLGKHQVFIANIQAAGIAINLTGANQVIMMEQEWTPAMNDQAVKRVHRHGQKQPVFVRMVCLANSLDERIVEILERKQKELTSIFDGDKPTPQPLADLLS